MTALAHAFRPDFSRLAALRNGHQPGWLKPVRQTAFYRFSELGFPTTKDEAWKYTRIEPLLAVPFERAEPGASRRLSPGVIDQLAGDFGGVRWVFVNGYFDPGLSSPARLPQGAQVTSLASAFIDKSEILEPLLSRPAQDHPQAFAALNAAFAEDGALVQIPPDTPLEEPIHLVYVSDAGAAPLASHPRTIILAGAGSRATVIDDYAGTQGEVYLTNAVTEVVLEEGAAVDHYKVQSESERAFHIAFLDVRQGSFSRFSSHSVALGSSLARHEVRVRLEAPGTETVLNGLYMARGKQHLDNPITIDHAEPHCTSRELYKGVIDERGRGVFDGRIIVRPGAMKTDASQTNKNLLLSESAEADTRPRLEIFADDVKCAHGAAVGQLDEEALFYYLRSRGIERQAARRLLTYAFASEMVELIRVDPLRARIKQLVGSRLPDGEKAGVLI